MNRLDPRLLDPPVVAGSGVSLDWAGMRLRFEAADDAAFRRQAVTHLARTLTESSRWLAIVLDLAADTPPYERMADGEAVCVLCEAGHRDAQLIVHDPGCAWQRARHAAADLLADLEQAAQR